MITQKSLRVLIVDDQESIRELLQRQLEKIGHTVVGKASNGLQAIELAGSLIPDVVLMDIEMPKMDGLEATKKIMNKYPRPVVLLTSYDDPEMVRQASQAGAGAYLLKPPSAEEIERTMIIAAARFADLMELRRLNSELKEALDNVKVLSGLLPICANCKSIRNDRGYWEAVEEYITENTEAYFSHSLCPACIDKLYPDYKPKKKQ
ncbi:MAG: response regulator transcription factor [Bacteroidota bacterium]|jgi:YesN/AraC family two-component response regulator